MFIPHIISQVPNQQFFLSELTSSATAVFHESVTLTCTVQGENLTDITPQISWFKSNSEDEAELFHTEIIQSTNSTSFEHILDSDAGSGEYHCKVNETVSNNSISIYFRSLTMKQLPEDAPVFKSQQVEIKVTQEGDIGPPHMQCQDESTNTPLGHTIVGKRKNLLEVKIKFKPEKSVTVVCDAGFSDGEMYSVNATIKVLGQFLILFRQ